MAKNILLENYLKSLEQKYNAVCFDIDGTLTENNSKRIDIRAIDMIVDLLKRKVPVVFITGRGETGLDDLKNDIYDYIRSNKNITDSDLKRMYVLTNDGARLFYSESTTNKEDFLSNNTYISTKEELEQLLLLDMVVNELKRKLDYNYFDITYSKDLKTQQIINIRMVFNTDDNRIINEIFDNIDNYIKSNNMNNIHLTRGVYKNKVVVQVGTATKDQAIERTEKIIGVPKNSMIRIGDCGDKRGNDYLMLNCSQGYSVDKTSGDLNSCFPVFDENGNILKGVDATLQLVKKAKILPTVCLEKADKESYKFKFAKIERNIVSGRQNLLKKYNDMIGKNFINCNGIDDLFDRNSGGIIIPMYEMELLEDNPLKELWLSFNTDGLKYSLRDDNNYILRGSSTYYYFIANRISTNGKDITSNDDVNNWHNNYLDFLNESITAIRTTSNINDQINKRLLLGILDNCRNILLVLINHYLVTNYRTQNVLLDITSNSDRFREELHNSILKIDSLMSKICFEDNYIIDKDEVISSVYSTKEVLIKDLYLEQKEKDMEDYSKDYRAYREIDNFAENYIAVSLYKENCDNNQIVNACGLSYGGIELPLLAKLIDRERIDKLLLLKFNKEVSGYTNKQLIDLRKFNINDFGGLTDSYGFRDTSVDVFDDNVLTGKTLQLAINSLLDCNIGVKNICIVRYPSINRIDQMFLNNPAAVDYNLFFNYIYGLCFNSPYSWKDDRWVKQNGRVDYTDSLGIFDLNRKKIIECILKNHDFNENSEVGEYKRRIIK